MLNLVYDPAVEPGVVHTCGALVRGPDLVWADVDRSNLGQFFQDVLFGQGKPFHYFIRYLPQEFRYSGLYLWFVGQFEGVAVMARMSNTLIGFDLGLALG